MPTVSVTVRSRVPHTTRLVRDRAEAATRKAAFDIEGHAKAGAPVDTGHLRNAINATGRGLDWRVTSPAAYSLYQEFGTRFMAAHPHMVPAAERVRPSYVAALRRLGV